MQSDYDVVVNLAHAYACFRISITNIRAHCAIWDKEDKLPYWLLEIESAGEIKDEVLRRVSYVGERYRGAVPHWDVNNEVIQGGWYEAKTGNHQFTEGVFGEMKKADPEAKLFLNDHGILTGGLYVNVSRRTRRAAMPYITNYRTPYTDTQ